MEDKYKDLLLDAEDYLKINDITKAKEVIQEYLNNTNIEKDTYTLDNPLEYVLLCDDLNKKEIKISPVNLSKAYAYLGCILIEENDYKQAREYLQKAIKLNPYNTYARFEEAESYKMASNYEKFHELTEETYKYIYKLEDLAKYLRNLAYYAVEEKEYELSKCLYIYAIQYDESKASYIKHELDYICDVSKSRDLPHNDYVINTLEKHHINIFISHHNLRKIYSFYDELKETDDDFKEYLRNLINSYEEFYIEES